MTPDLENLSVNEGYSVQAKDGTHYFVFLPESQWACFKMLQKYASLSIDQVFQLAEELGPDFDRGDFAYSIAYRLWEKYGGYIKAYAQEGANIRPIVCDSEMSSAAEDALVAWNTAKTNEN